MRLTHLARLALVLAPALAACDEEGDLGIGINGKDRFSASLSGAGVRPNPVNTTASATADFTLREPDIGQSQETITYAIRVSNLTSASAVHIHLGGAAVSNGQLLATLYTNPTDSAITATQLAAGALVGSTVPAISFDSLVTLMESGAAYLDIHTTLNPNGLLRGQIVKSGNQAPGDIFTATGLSGAKERPNPVVSTASGSASFELLTGGTVRYNVTVAGLTGATMAHIHTGVADSAGPIAVTLFTSATPTGPISGTLTSGTFGASNIQLNGVSLDSLLSLMRNGRTYVNVHTFTNPLGEIRAQIQPASRLP